jgi:hypothetical protein
VCISKKSCVFLKKRVYFVSRVDKALFTLLNITRLQKIGKCFGLQKIDNYANFASLLGLIHTKYFRAQSCYKNTLLIQYFFPVCIEIFGQF